MALEMMRYACTVCSYGYHPLKGDPENGIPPGMPFDDLRMAGAARGAGHLGRSLCRRGKSRATFVKEIYEYDIARGH